MSAGYFQCCGNAIGHGHKRTCPKWSAEPVYVPPRFVDGFLRADWRACFVERTLADLRRMFAGYLKKGATK